MNVSRLSLLAGSALLVACASQPRTTAAPAATVVESPATAPVAASPAATATSPAAELDAPAANRASGTGASGGAPTAAEDDYAALYGGPAPGAPEAVGANGELAPPAYDPWERYNRSMHRFNMAVDRGVARPLATAYVAVTPQPVRLGVTNFFDNLRSPLSMVNQLLQGRPVHALQTLGRFVLNSTLGIGGLLDPASAAKIPRRSEDFGQTLGVWGWRNSRYFELPLFGPRTVRDTFGLAGDIPLAPLRQVENDKVRIGLQGLQLVDTRSQLLSLDSLRDQAVDEYALTRDAWLQRRNYQIERDLRHRRGSEEDVPEYLRDEKDTTVPVDAMPIPDFGN